MDTRKIRTIEEEKLENWTRVIEEAVRLAGLGLPITISADNAEIFLGSPGAEISVSCDGVITRKGEEGTVQDVQDVLHDMVKERIYRARVLARIADVMKEVG